MTQDIAPEQRPRWKGRERRNGPAVIGTGDYWHLVEQSFSQADSAPTAMMEVLNYELATDEREAARHGPGRPRWQWKWAAYKVTLKQWPGTAPVVVQWQGWRDGWMLDDGRSYPYDPHGMYDVLCAAARKLADLAGLTDADLPDEAERRAD